MKLRCRGSTEKSAQFCRTLRRQLSVLGKSTVIIERGLNVIAHVHECNGKSFIALPEVGLVAGIEKSKPCIRRKLPELKSFIYICGKRLCIRTRRIHFVALIQHLKRPEIIPVLQTVFYRFQHKFVAEIQRLNVIFLHALSPKSLRKSSSSNV